MLIGTSALAEHPGTNHLPDSAEAALNSAAEITLFSIRPEFLPPPHHDEGFHGHEILGSVIITDATVTASIRKNILDALSAYDDGNYACCFNPRHGLRIRTAIQTFDFVLCFECTKLVIYAGNKSLGKTLGISGTPKPLDEILTANKIPLPPPAKVSK